MTISPNKTLILKLNKLEVKIDYMWGLNNKIKGSKGSSGLGSKNIK